LSREATAPTNRLASIDQLRGYAIFGMLLVNSCRAFGIECDLITHHQDHFSYADTIAPLFMFVVGMTMRLSWLRQSPRIGESAVRRAMYRRFGLMVLIAFAVYAGWLWDALMDIGLAGLLCVWLIDKKPRVRLAAAFIMPAIYQIIYLTTWYGPWINRAVKATADTIPLWVKLIPLHEALFRVALNGGPFGPLSRAMMILFGSLAYDWMIAGNEKRFIGYCLGWGAALCAVGYALSIPWPGFKQEWPISAYPSTAPFPLMTTGTAFFALLVFHGLCDKLNLRIPTFSEVGMNPLLIYITQGLMLEVIDDFDPINAGVPVGVICFLMFYGAFAAWAYYLKSRRIFIKI
jgi:predicted acyltransferase